MTPIRTDLSVQAATYHDMLTRDEITTSLGEARAEVAALNDTIRETVAAMADATTDTERRRLAAHEGETLDRRLRAEERATALHMALSRPIETPVWTLSGAARNVSLFIDETTNAPYVYKLVSTPAPWWAPRPITVHGQRAAHVLGEIFAADTDGTLGLAARKVAFRALSRTTTVQSLGEVEYSRAADHLAGMHVANVVAFLTREIELAAEVDRTAAALVTAQRLMELAAGTSRHGAMIEREYEARQAADQAARAARI